MPPLVPLHKGDSIREKELLVNKLHVASPGSPRAKDNLPVATLPASQEQPEQQQQTLTVRKEFYKKKHIF